jgi:chemotaxis protein histidine kinase CheA
MNSLIKRQENTTTTSPPADEIVEEVVNEEVIEEELPEVEPPVTPEVPVEPPIPAGPTQEELDKIAADKKADKEAQDLLDQEAAEEKARLAAEKKAAVEKAAAQKAAEEEADSKKANDDKAAADLAETNRLADERAASLEQQRQQQQIQKQASTRHFNSLNRLQAVNTETVQVEEVEEETVTEEEAETEDVVDSGFDVPPVEVFVDSGAVSVPVVAQKPFTDGVTSIGGSASDGDSSNGLGIGAIGGVIAVALVAVLSIGFFVVKRRRGTNKERVASMNPFLSSSPEIIIDAPSESKRGMHDMLFTAPAATVVQMPPLTSSPVSTYSPILQAQDGSFFGDAAPSMHDSIVLGNQPWFGSVTTDTTSEMSSEDGWSGGELNDAIDASGDRGSLYNSIYSAKTMGMLNYPLILFRHLNRRDNR